MTMKYSYMPTKAFVGMSHVNCVNYYAIESDKVVMDFRNQYGRKFIFAPKSVVHLLLLASLVVGYLIGKLI